MKTLLFISALLIFGLTHTAAGSEGGTWTASPFDQKVFIENRGQFDGKNGNEQTKILFGTSVDGVDLYFTKTGLTYRHDEAVPMTEEEKESTGHHGAANNKREEKERKMMKLIPRYLSMEWVGSNPAVEIITQDSVSFYYTYSADEGMITAHAYKKLIYKNLYPNIDVEYIFPEGKNGMKYTIVVHPGGDASQMKMTYSDAKGLLLNDEGNVVIKSSFGEFVDHAPLTTVDKLEILSSFVVSGNEVSFNVNTYDKTQTLIIDPWTTNPNFFGYNGALDINYDLNGNVYIYGSYNPFKLAKLNGAGSIQWVLNVIAGFGNFGGMDYYGDFAVDEVSGTSYLVEGVNTLGPRVLKVNTLGNITGSLWGNVYMNEMWRAEYNRCINKIVIVGGGTAAFRNYQAAILDTNLTTITPFDIVNSPGECCHDMMLLAIDNDSNFCYMATTKESAYRKHDNILIKCAIPNLATKVFSVPDGHKFSEIGSLWESYGRPHTCANGMNGIAVSHDWLYTYNSDSLKRWNKTTGTLSGSRHIAPRLPDYNTYDTTIIVRWGGLSVDECDNVYVGVFDSIKKYNSSLSLIKTFTLPDTVYDVKVGPNNKLYACGKGFVTQINGLPNIRLTQTPDTCNKCHGAAMVVRLCDRSPCGGSSVSYSWNTTPVQTTQTATGLCPGTYTVRVTIVSNGDSSIIIDSVTVTSKGKVTPAITGTTTLCQGDSTVLTASGGIDYFWSTGATTRWIKVSPQTTTSYIVTVSNDWGCSASDTVTVTVNPQPVANAGSDLTVCSGDSVQLKAIGGTTYSWSPTTGLSDPTIADPLAFPSLTTDYVVTVSNGTCMDQDTVAVTVLPVMTYTITPDSIDLGVTNVGKTKDGKIVFTNNNTSNVRISDIHFTPTSFGTIATQFPKTLGGGESLTIKFTASAPDTLLYQAQLCVTVDSACPAERCIPVKIEGASMCMEPQVADFLGKKPGEIVKIPILLTPSTKFTNAKNIDISVNYDKTLVRFVKDPTSLIGNIDSVKPRENGVSFSVTNITSIPTPTSTIAEIYVEALLAPYANGTVDVSSPTITLSSGEVVTGGSCPASFYLDSSCILPSSLRPRPSVEIVGIYPNPSWTQATLELTSQNNPQVMIEVYDVFGRRVETLFNNVLTDGRNEIAITTFNYANGIYFCRIVCDSHILTKTFNVNQ